MAVLPFSSAVVDGVSMLSPGQPATALAFLDGTNVHLNFGIPQGVQGEQGMQGVPGEVTNAALNSAIAGTTANTNSVETLDTPFADHDTEAIRQGFNALVLTLRR